MARLVMSPQIFNISEHLHATWLTAHYLHIVQFNCKETNSNLEIQYAGQMKNLVLVHEHDVSNMNTLHLLIS
jgi:hypothetical protein